VIQLALAVGGLALTVWLIRVIDAARVVPGRAVAAGLRAVRRRAVLSGVVLGLVGSYGAALAIVLGNDRRVADWQASAQAHRGPQGLPAAARRRPAGRPCTRRARRVCHDWDLAPARAAGGVRPVPAGGARRRGWPRRRSSSPAPRASGVARSTSPTRRRRCVTAR
jgi:hypothetical protein